MGLSGLKTICSDLDLLTPCEQQNIFQQYQQVYLKSTNVATEKLLKDGGNKLFNIILENEPEKVDVNDDGTQDVIINWYANKVSL